MPRQISTTKARFLDLVKLKLVDRLTPVDVLTLVGKLTPVDVLKLVDELTPVEKLTLVDKLTQILERIKKPTLPGISTGNAPQFQPVLPSEEIEAQQITKRLDELKPIAPVSPKISTENAPQFPQTSFDKYNKSEEYLPGDEISIAQIQKMKNLYRDNRLNLISQHSSGITSNKNDALRNRGGFQDTQSCWFSRDIIEKLITQSEKCVGVRIYYGVYGVDGEPSFKDSYHNAILVGLKLNKAGEALKLTDWDRILNESRSEHLIGKYFEDMLEDEDLVALPRRVISEPSTSPDDDNSESALNKAYDFGGLGPPMQAPGSVLG